MTTFENREKAHENKFAYDKAVEFKIVSRRRKLLGLWAADKMRKSDEEALMYALSIVQFGIDDTAGGAVVKKIMSDINASGFSNVTEEDVRFAMGQFHELATQQILAS